MLAHGLSRLGLGSDAAGSRHACRRAWPRLGGPTQGRSRPARPPSPLQLVREGGWGALFAGLEASLIGTTVSQGIYFYL